MLSSVLRGARAVRVNIAMMRAFVRLRDLNRAEIRTTAGNRLSTDCADEHRCRLRAGRNGESQRKDASAVAMAMADRKARRRKGGPHQGGRNPGDCWNLEFRNSGSGFLRPNRAENRVNAGSELSAEERRGAQIKPARMQNRFVRLLGLLFSVVSREQTGPSCWHEDPARRSLAGVPVGGKPWPSTNFGSEPEAA
jgi:hypothetical protein